ncbi:hypothetical protein [Microvirga tunisiensis]|uniref:hypothetical protein n=1 Tax=Microvirga tunisiensis TaxID=2108360 RepID=UPI00128BE7CF|nr:hypothetical protein [Microvirga tunisiensis]MPR13152.1 hypothetical protein [Microvirga tunisiensis]
MLDHVPRDLAEDGAFTLKTLARQAMAQLELRAPSAISAISSSRTSVGASSGLPDMRLFSRPML